MKKTAIVVALILIASSSFGFMIEGKGRVSGPSSSTDNRVVCWNGTTATTLKDCTSSSTIPGLTSTGTVTSTGFSASGASTLSQTSAQPYSSVSGTATLTTTQVSNGLINNYNASCAQVTYTLPAAAFGLSAGFVCGCSQQIYIDPNGSEVIRLDGTDLTGGFRVASAASCTVGDFLVCRTWQTGASTWKWMCNTVTGVWSNAGS